MWDLDRDENYILNLETGGVVDVTETILCVAYCPAKGEYMSEYFP